MPSEPRILVRKSCAGLEPGFHFFQDLMETDELVFTGLRRVDETSEDFSHLKESIRLHGVRVPVQLSYDQDQGILRVLAGERRIRAVRAIRLEQAEAPVLLPALVSTGQGRAVDTSLADTITVVVSNLLQPELSQVEKMRCYRLLHEKGLNKKAIALACGKDRKTIERSLQLAEFDEDVLAFIEEHERHGLLKARHVEVIGQKLRQSLTKLDQEQAERLAATTADSPEQERLCSDLEGKRREVRDAAFHVLQEEVRRRREAKQPRSDMEKLAARERRENTRRVDMRALRSALEEGFSEDEVERILGIIDELDQSRDPGATQTITADFARVGIGGEARGTPQ